MEQEREKTSTSVPVEEAKMDWLKEQDAQLQNLVTTYGTKDWAVISEALNVVFPLKAKSAKECCNRWQELLEIESAKKAWTEQDELSMIIAHKKHKNRWADISESLKGRSNNTIKNKFYSVFRKIRGKILKCDCSYVSKLELLEIHYIVSLIEQYLAHPLLVPKPKGKRGKDFIYSLIHSLNDKMVADYKAKIQELTKHEGTMEELFAKLSAQLKAALEKNGNGPTPALTQMQNQNQNGSTGAVPHQHNHSHPPEKPRATTARFMHRKDEMKEQKVLLCDPVKIEDDRLLGAVPFQRDGAAMDSSPLFGYAPMSPPLVFSPNPLSAGPEAVAAAAARAPCFGHGLNDFSEFSHMMKFYGERPKADSIFQVPRSNSMQIRSLAQRQLAAHQAQIYSNLAGKPPYHFT